MRGHFLVQPFTALIWAGGANRTGPLFPPIRVRRQEPPVVAVGSEPGLALEPHCLLDHLQPVGEPRTSFRMVSSEAATFSAASIWSWTVPSSLAISPCARSHRCRRYRRTICGARSPPRQGNLQLFPQWFGSLTALR